MATENLFVVRSETDLERCYPVMKELRPHLSYEEYLYIYTQSHTSDGYEIVAIEEDGKILAVMGYRLLSDYVRGKHVYVDDLVTTEKIRSRGLGVKLLAYAEEVAERAGCKSLRLCTGLDNLRGMQFYERNGWIKRSVAYVKKI